VTPTPEDPEARRARRLAEIRAQRGTEDRARQIADLEARKAYEPEPVARTRATTSSGSSGSTRSSSSRPKRSSGKTAGTSFFGHPWSEWHQMVDTGVDHLAEHAEAQSTTTPDALWKHIGAEMALTLGDPRLPMPFLLRDITNRQLDDTGLLLSALVVTDDGTPEPAFFRLAAQLDKLPAAQAPRESDDATWTMTERQEAFWRQQVERLYETYGAD
jgi:hypothetical protein